MTQNVTPAAPYNHNAQQIIEVTGAGTVTCPDNVDFVDVVVTGVTVKLPVTALPGKLVRVAAPAGGSVTINGNGHSIRGGATTVSASTVRGYERSNLGDWVPDASGGGGSVLGAPIGMLQVDLAGDSDFTITDADLDNPDHAGSKYLGISVGGDSIEGIRRVVLPTPAGDTDSYEIVAEVFDVLNGDILNFDLEPTTGFSASIVAPTLGAVELVYAAATTAIADASAGGSPASLNVRSTRMRLLVQPSGVWLDNGYTGTPVGD